MRWPCKLMGLRMTEFKSASFVVLALGASIVSLASVAAFAEADDRYRFFQQNAPAAGSFEGVFSQQPTVREVAPRRVELRPVEVKEPQSEKQYPVASVMDDPTLRPGDMVVTERGIVVFTGRRGDRHDASDFSAVSYAALPKADRTFVAQIDGQARGSSEGYDTGALGEQRLAVKVAAGKAKRKQANNRRPTVYAAGF